jgi:hypothetical protein
MRTTQRLRLGVRLGVFALALPLVLSGCGGSSYQSNSFGTYPDAGPAAYGIEGTGANGNITGGVGGPFVYETSGFGNTAGTTASLTAATDFKVVKGAGPLPGVDPNGTGKVPLGFSPKGAYIDALSGASPVTPQALAPGVSVVFRADISNGESSKTRSVIPIQYNGVSLSSTDPEWTLGTLPMTFNFTNGGPLSNGTYVTGTPVQSGTGTPVPFTLPFTSTGLHEVAVTVTDTSGQQTQTFYETVVVRPTDVAVFAQNVTPDGGAAQAITAGSTASITNPVSGATTQATADAQGTVILFTTPGTQTLTVTSTDGKTTVTQTLTIAASAAGTTLIQ